MRGLLELICLAIMWPVALSRVPGLRIPDLSYRLAAIALLSWVTSVTIRQPAIARWLAATVGPPLPFIAETSLAIIAVTALMTWTLLLLSPADSRRWRHGALAIWMVAALMCLGLAALVLGNELASFSTYAAVGMHMATDAQLLFLGIYESYWVLAMVVAAALFARLLLRSLNNRWLVGGCALLVAACLGSCARSVYTFIYLLPQITDLPWPTDLWSSRFTVSVNMPSYAAVFVGTLLPGLPLLPVLLRRRLQQRRQLEVVTPLWRDLREAFPTLQRARHRGANKLTIRTSEIFEATLRLRAHASPASLQAARAYVAGLQVPGDRREAVAYACWIAYALQQHHNQAYTSTAGWRPHPNAGHEMTTGQEWITRVAYEYVHSPLVPHFTESAPGPPMGLASTC